VQDLTPVSEHRQGQSLHLIADSTTKITGHSITNASSQASLTSTPTPPDIEVAFFVSFLVSDG
jgi:chemotaxis protein CheY-P-specific phosphatase CheC